MKRALIYTVALLVSLSFNIQPSSAAEEFELKIKDHKFDPEIVKVPAGKKIKLKVINLDPTPEEFESYDLNREKIIGGNKTGIVFIGPLKPGVYGFFGEFNMDTAQGKVVAE